MEKQFLTVGELAKKMQVTIRTLQYYDKENILKPSAFSEGGRRLYSKKDIIKLHQIIELKHLGFSLKEIKSQLFLLDTPEEVIKVLALQRNVIQERIDSYQNLMKAITTLEEEVRGIGKVDFVQYADIIEMLKQGNENYWVWKYLDDPLKEHIRTRFGENPEAGVEIFETYKDILEEALILKEQEDWRSERSLVLAKKWWDMIMAFTGGDMSLIPLLEKFNEDSWDGPLSIKQKEVDTYLERILKHYFEQLNGG